MFNIDLSKLNGTGYSDLSSFVLQMINYVIAVSVVIVVISLLSAGFKFMLSGGDDKKISEASRSLLFSIIGLILVFLSPNIVKFIVNELLK